MKTLFILLTGILLLTANNKAEPIDLHIQQSSLIECPECTRKYNECINPLHNGYTTTVAKAADKLKEGKITKDEYSTACAKARRIKDKGITACTTEYHKCCLAETKTEMEKNNEKKEEQ